MMDLPCVVIYGKQSEDVLAVRRAFDLESITVGGTTVWKIDNKYYSADISIYTLLEGASIDSLPTNSDHQAVVAVFNSDTDSFSAIQQLWESINHHSGYYVIKIAVLLCREQPEWVHEADAWFGGQLTELVIVDQRADRNPNPEIGEEQIRTEKSGLDRLLEALQSHIWPGMKRKPAVIQGTSTVDQKAENNEKDTSLQMELMKDALRVQNDEDTEQIDDDDLNAIFNEIVAFKDKIGNASHAERAAVATDTILRLQVLLGEDSSEDEEEEESE